MPELDSEVTSQQLTINPTARAIVQCRRRQSPKKAEAAEKAIRDLLEENFTEYTMLNAPREGILAKFKDG